VSATGATDYRDGGTYYTPVGVARKIVGRWAPEFRAYPTTGRHVGRLLRVLDPSAGGGAFPMALLHHGLVQPGSMEVMDLDPAARALRLPAGMLRTVATVTDDPVRTGYLVTDPQQQPDLVTGNPPFGVPRPAERCTDCDGAGTLTTRARWAVVDGDRMRMLQPHEAATAQGFPASYQLPRKRDGSVHVTLANHLIGNAVAPPLARDLLVEVLRAA